MSRVPSGMVHPVLLLSMLALSPRLALAAEAITGQEAHAIGVNAYLYFYSPAPWT